MSTTTDTPNRAARFIERLRKITNDRGKMAALRRAASPSTERQAWPVIYSLGEDISCLAACTIGGLYAQHPEEDGKAFSFGTTCRRIATDNGKDFEIPDSFDRRFRRLLACDSADDVAGQLKAWIRFASAKGVGVNYEKLFWDILAWHNHADRIKLDWARGFWPVRREASEEPLTGEATP
ncbi:MAG: type I-E CRISPR-associated protein Cse2/CasB [Verrucomicrobia bacterium]|nr:type I-E CRISPR-associated protein Cse2/CasB [Verrucomicrobiota bacterium]